MYDKYIFSVKEWGILVGKYAGLAALTGYLFYRSMFASVILFFLIIPGFHLEKNTKIKQRKQKLKSQFKDAILSVSNALQAGYSVENGFKEAVKDMIRMYGEQELITQEFMILCHKMERNESVEAAFMDLANRSGIDEIKNFAEVFWSGKRAGGNVVGMIQDCVEIISMKIEVEEEIQTLLTGKQLEEKVMSIVPFFIILYIDITSPGFFSIMYGNILGIVIMTICLVVYGIAVWLGRKIIEIYI